MKIGILGGGLSGLILGYHLNKEFEILEQNEQCGGLCRTFQEDGFTFDYCGSHVIFSKDQEILTFFEKLLGNNAVKCRRNSKIFYKGRFVKYPFENGLSDLPREDNYECLIYFLTNLIKRERGELPRPKNFKEWIYYTFGKGIAEKYMIPYNEKIWNTKTELMSAEWVKDRIPQPPFEDVIKASLGLETEGYLHQLYFIYPKIGGIQSLINAIADKIRDKIIYNFRVDSIRKENHGFIVSSGKNEREYDKIVSTIPLPEIVKIINDVPENVLNAAKNLRWNSLITVMIGLEGSDLNNISWIYFPDEEDGKFNRVCFPFNYSKLVVPQGKSSVIAEITCNYKDDLWKLEDDLIMEEVISDLDKNKIIDKTQVCFTKVKRTKYAYIIYNLDYNRNIHVVKNFLNNFGIELCGRFAEFKYMNMDDCAKSAINKAKALNLVV